jgi:hypothetical protein
MKFFMHIKTYIYKKKLIELLETGTINLAILFRS